MGIEPNINGSLKQAEREELAEQARQEKLAKKMQNKMKKIEAEMKKTQGKRSFSGPFYTTQKEGQNDQSRQISGNNSNN